MSIKQIIIENTVGGLVTQSNGKMFPLRSGGKPASYSWCSPSFNYYEDPYGAWTNEGGSYDGNWITMGLTQANDKQLILWPVGGPTVNCLKIKADIVSAPLLKPHLDIRIYDYNIEDYRLVCADKEFEKEVVTIVEFPSSVAGDVDVNFKNIGTTAGYLYEVQLGFKS